MAWQLWHDVAKEAWRPWHSVPKDGQWVFLLVGGVRRIARWSKSRSSWEMPGLLGSRRKQISVADSDRNRWAPR